MLERIPISVTTVDELVLRKTSGRMERMKTFQSSPVHLACLHGEARL
jgi:hypothetical protein